MYLKDYIFIDFCFCKHFLGLFSNSKFSHSVKKNCYIIFSFFKHFVIVAIFNFMMEFFYKRNIRSKKIY